MNTSKELKENQERWGRIMTGGAKEIKNNKWWRKFLRQINLYRIWVNWIQAGNEIGDMPINRLGLSFAIAFLLILIFSGAIVINVNF